VLKDEMLNYKMTAEWENHEATWISFPHAESLTWDASMIDWIRPTMLRFIEALSEGESVFVNVSSEACRKYVEGELREDVLAKVRFFDVPTNDPWCRDHSPIYSLDRVTGRRRATAFRFNSWGGKYPHDLDGKASLRMAQGLGGSVLESPFFVEGGSLETDGTGRIMISASSVINENRNSGWTRDAAEAHFEDVLGVNEVIWTDAELKGDDTDGHVDNYARFTGVNRIAVAISENAGDVNYAPLKKSAEELEALNFDNVVRIPMPDKPVVMHDTIVPATYVNFYIANGQVIVPRFGDVNDDCAVEILAAEFPDRKITQIDGGELLYGQGGFHCASQSVPAVVE
jgi:agmatine deiminase